MTADPIITAVQAALRLAVEEERDSGASYLTLPMISAALAYFETERQ